MEAPRKLKSKVLSLAFISLTGISLAFFGFKGNEVQRNQINQTKQVKRIKMIEIHSTQELIEVLDRHGMWDLENKKQLLTEVIKNFPSDFKNISDETQRRKIFIYTVLPSALVALTEIQRERKQLKEILQKLPDAPKLTAFNIKKRLSTPEVEFIVHLTNKYRTSDPQELLKRVNVVPLSLLLAQAALESNWGTSRFALEGNNLFGIWTYKRKGMVPLNRPPNAFYRVARYSSILEAVRDYLYNLNVGWAYTEFRTARLCTMDAEELAQCLPRYSQLGLVYAEQLKAIINTYHLKVYETKFKPYLAQLNLYNN